MFNSISGLCIHPQVPVAPSPHCDNQGNLQTAGFLGEGGQGTKLSLVERDRQTKLLIAVACLPVSQGNAGGGAGGLGGKMCISCAYLHIAGGWWVAPFISLKVYVWTSAAQLPSKASMYRVGSP